MKIHRRGAWIVLRFHLPQHRRDFKKIHLFVDLVSKKIIYCLVTTGKASDAKQVKKLLKVVGGSGSMSFLPMVDMIPENALIQSPTPEQSQVFLYEETLSPNLMGVTANERQFLHSNKIILSGRNRCIIGCGV
jgi:hypothetical protein